MTSLLGLKLEDGTVYLAADRLTTGSHVASRTESKIVKAGKWRIAYCGPSFGQCVIERLPLDSSDDPFDLALAVRSRLDELKWEAEKDKGAATYGMLLLLARPGCLWRCGTDFALVDIEPGMLAEGGSGGEHARGAAQALLETRRGEWTIPAILGKAIEIASRFDTDTGGEPEVVTIPAVLKHPDCDDAGPWSGRGILTSPGGTFVANRFP
jgi:ATP-dependent protease HslVU (ClpYQ) peptidase subunit